MLYAAYDEKALSEMAYKYDSQGKIMEESDSLGIKPFLSDEPAAGWISAISNTKSPGNVIKASGGTGFERKLEYNAE